jgi:tetratricopeptide (TPR) repeat protein
LNTVGDSSVHRAIINNLKGGLFLAQKDTGCGQKAFAAAIQENPDFMPPYYALARIYLSANSSKRPSTSTWRFWKKIPNQAGPHMLLGTIYDMQKQFDMSEKHYRAALEINPQFAPAANNLAYLLSSRDGDIDEALAFARIAKEKLPDDPSVMDTLGWIYYKKGLYGNAVQEFSDSLEKLPENATVHYHLGAALFKKGEKARQNPYWRRPWHWTGISTEPKMPGGCCLSYKNPDPMDRIFHGCHIRCAIFPLKR